MDPLIKVEPEVEVESHQVLTAFSITELIPIAGTSNLYLRKLPESAPGNVHKRLKVSEGSSITQGKEGASEESWEISPSINEITIIKQEPEESEELHLRNSKDADNSTSAAEQEDSRPNIPRRGNIEPTFESAHVYNEEYARFHKWLTANNRKFCEESLREYFSGLTTSEGAAIAPSSLWQKYSMLKKTIETKHNIDIGKYKSLVTHIKECNANYKPKQAPILQNEDIQRFLSDAPDSEYLIHKTAQPQNSTSALEERPTDLKKVQDDVQKILLCLTELSKTVAKLDDKVNLLVQNIQNPKEANTKSIFRKLPLKSISDLDEIDNIVTIKDTNNTVLKDLLHFLQNNNGTEKQKLRKLKQLFSAELLKKVNWTGIRGKRRMRGSPLMELISTLWDSNEEHMPYRFTILKQHAVNTINMRAKRLKLSEKKES